MRENTFCSLCAILYLFKYWVNFTDKNRNKLCCHLCWETLQQNQVLVKLLWMISKYHWLSYSENKWFQTCFGRNDFLLKATVAKLIQHHHPTLTTWVTSKQTLFPAWNKKVKDKQVLNGRSAPLLFFSGTDGLVDVFLWRLGAVRHFTCVNLVHVPVWRLDVQIAAYLVSLVRSVDGGAGRDPTAHWTPTDQPGHFCKRHRLTGQTEQSGFVGAELSTGRREDSQDRRREAGAWKHNKDMNY